MWLVTQNVPWRVVFGSEADDLLQDEAFQMAAVVVTGEFQGNSFDWKRGQFRERQP